MKTHVEPSGHSSSLIAYCALHRRIPSVTPSDYRSTMLAFHRRLHDESRRFHASMITQREARDNSLARSISSLVGNTLPETDIIKAIASNRSELPVAGLIRSMETELIETSTREPATRQLCLNGEEYLTNLGFPVSLRSSIYESSFIIQGSANLDSLEILVRDGLGIYGGTHGKHLREFEQYAYALYNLLLEGGGASFDGVTERFREVSLYFSKPDPTIIKYAPFRKGLNGMVSMLDQAVGVYTSLWQRKLGLGVGSEFILRIAFEDQERLSEILSILSGFSGDSVVRSSVLDRGSLVNRQVSFAQSVAADE